MLSQIVGYLALFFTGLGTLQDPFIGLCAYYFLALCRPQDMYWWGLGQTRLSFFTALGVCGIWLLKWMQKEHVGPGRSAVNTLMLVFFLLKVVSACFAADQAAAWGHLDKVYKIVLFYYITVSLVDTRDRFRWMTVVMAFSLGYLALWGNWQWYVVGRGGGEWGELAGPGWAINAALADRNLFGLSLVIGIPVCFFFFAVERNVFWRIAALGCIPLLVNAVMLTYSRGAFLGMIACAGCSALRLRRVDLVVGCAILGSLMIGRLAGQGVRDRISTVQTYQGDRSAASRIESWKAGLAMVRDYPITGVGPENYAYYSYSYAESSLVFEGMVAHNEFVQTAAETGIPSVLAQLAIIWLTFSSLYQVRRATWSAPDTRWAYYYAAMIESSLIGYTICALFLTLPYFEPFYLLAGLTLCLRRIVEGHGLMARAMPESHQAMHRPVPLFTHSQQVPEGMAIGIGPHSRDARGN